MPRNARGVVCGSRACSFRRSECGIQRTSRGDESRERSDGPRWAIRYPGPTSPGCGRSFADIRGNARDVSTTPRQFALRPALSPSVPRDGVPRVLPGAGVVSLGGPPATSRPVTKALSGFGEPPDRSFTVTSCMSAMASATPTDLRPDVGTPGRSALSSRQRVRPEAHPARRRTPPRTRLASGRSHR